MKSAKAAIRNAGPAPASRAGGGLDAAPMKNALFSRVCLVLMPRHPASLLFRMTTAATRLLWVPVLLLCLHSSRAELLFYDAFAYTGAETLGTGSSSADWENAKSNITISEGSLSYPGLQTSSGNRVNVSGGSSNLDGTRTVDGSWASQTNGALYVSFLLRLNGTGGIATSGDGTPIVNISRAGSGSQQLISVNLLNDSGVKLGVLKYPSSGTPVASAFFTAGPGAGLSANGTTTYLVVAKYEWVEGAANDVVTLWVNPANLGGSEDPGNRISTSAGTDGTANAGRFYINRGPSLNLDELRIATTWAEVTPTGAAVVPSQPHITEGFLSPAGFVLRGTNGSPSGTYQVLSSPDLRAAAHLWAAIATNVFDAQGGFETTHPVPSGVPQAFYRLLLGGDIPVAPSLSTQPSDLTVLVGEDAPFSVIAGGSLPLAYQWFFDGEPIAGATSVAHTVTGAQATDAGEYHVVVTNSIGSVTSAVATLTVVPVPPAGVPDGYATLGNGTTGGAGGPIGDGQHVRGF
jgi:hypothetical protein